MLPVQTTEGPAENSEAFLFSIFNGVLVAGADPRHTPDISGVQGKMVAGVNPQHALPPKKRQDSLGTHVRNPLNLLFNAYDITDVRKKSAL